MARKDTSKDIVEHYKSGMQPIEIAARLLLDIQTVESAITAFERGETSGRKREEFIESELRKGISLLDEKVERLFEEKEYEQFNKAYSNWLESIRTYIKMLDKKELNELEDWSNEEKSY